VIERGAKRELPGVAKMRAARPFTVPAFSWLVYGLLLMPYIAIRSLGDGWLPWHDGEALERRFFFGTPTRFLQDHIYARDLTWFDFAGFLLHISWFIAPLVVFVVIAIFERKRFPEFIAWCLACSYLSDIGYLVLPVRPPWMEAGITRVLEVRQFIPYTGVDNNPVAALPSLHAAFPLMMALFVFARCPRLRKMAWALTAYALAIGFAVVYLGEHWLLDVLSGYVFAGGIALLFTAPAVSRALNALPGQLPRRLAAWDAKLYAASCRPADPGDELAARRAAREAKGRAA
jgi:membrane-associated phospholipid phosphatase